MSSDHPIATMQQSIPSADIILPAVNAEVVTNKSSIEDPGVAAVSISSTNIIKQQDES